ncbi:MAG: hypothetical protein HY055_04835 [Magnetospirillum sp.]|nr:hypothetical protein [Magnetospirillum sp.]
MPRDDVGGKKWMEGQVKRDPRDHNDVVKVINETLKTRVADIFRTLIPAFEDTPGAEFYDIVMTNSEMLHGCITIFRRRRDAFRNLLVDGRGRPVNDDFVALRCGRSVHDVIAMIVRTHAKRHFKATLGGDPNNPASRAGRMYQAINEYLIHDWQVPLVPHYAPLPLHKVQEMGPRLLDIREAEILDAITAAANASHALPMPMSMPVPPPPSTPPPLPPRFEVRAADSPMGAGPSRNRPPMPEARPAGTPQEEFWWDALTDRSVVAVLGSRGNNEMREIVAALAGLNETVRAELFAGLSLTTYQAAVCMATAFKALGRAGFNSMFGEPGKPAQIIALGRQMKKRGIGSRTELRALPAHVEGALKG